MKKFVTGSMLLLTLTFGVACSNNNNRTAADNTAAPANDDANRTIAGNTDVDGRVKYALQQANMNDVRVDVDNDKKLLTLNGDVRSEADKSRAAEIAKANAAGFTIANQIGIRPDGDAGDVAEKVDDKNDRAIKAEWKALEAKMRLENQHINADVKNGVLKLKGDVDNDSMRQKVEQAASKIPHVKQVVNELQVKSAAQ